LLPLAAGKLHRVLQAVRVVRDAVLADRRALRAVPAQTEGRVEHGFLADPDAVLHHGVDGATHRAVRADRALDLYLAVVGLRLGLADHAVRQLCRDRAGAHGNARALEEGAAIDGAGERAGQAAGEPTLRSSAGSRFPG